MLAALAWSVGWALAGWPWLAALGAALIAGFNLLVLALEFVLMRRANAQDPAPRPTVGELARAWWAEVRVFVQLFGHEMARHEHRHPDHLPAQAQGQRGLVLVHGFFCNRALWNFWFERLRSHGIAHVAVSLEPPFGRIEDYPAAVEAAVLRLTAATGMAPLLVGHSMGGLVIRAWARSHGGAGRMHAAITLGTPHAGTWLARFSHSPNARQMRQGSRFLLELAGAEEAALYSRFTCFYSHCDNIVFPARTATLPGADNRHLRGQPHVDMIHHPAVFEAVLRALRPGS